MENRLLDKMDNYDCPSCKKAMTKIVRISEEGSGSMNTAYVCTNKDCTMKVNLDNVKTWKRC